MAYDIHITKRNRWTDKGSDITPEDWEHLLATNNDLVPVEKIEGETKAGDRFEYKLKESELARWENLSSGSTVWLVFQKGVINISGPDESIIKKAKEIALKLSAKVQGDELEIY